VVCLGIVHSLALGTGEVGGVLSAELEGVVYQLLRVRYIRVEMAHDVQDIDRERIGSVSFFAGDKNLKLVRAVR